MSEAVTMFENTTAGWVGAIKLMRNGDRRAVAIEPHGRIELTEEEQQLTADAPRNAADSPFEPKEYASYDEAGEVVEQGVRPALREVTEERETPAKREAPEGTRDEREVVGA